MSCAPRKSPSGGPHASTRHTLARDRRWRPRPPSRWAWRLMGTVLVGMAAGFFAARALGFGAPRSAGGDRVRPDLLRRGARDGCAPPCRWPLVLGGDRGRLQHPRGGHDRLPGRRGARDGLRGLHHDRDDRGQARRPARRNGRVLWRTSWSPASAFSSRRRSDRKSAQVGVLGLIGLADGLALVVVRAGVEQLVGTAPPPDASGQHPSLLPPMIASVRTFDDTAKDGGPTCHRPGHRHVRLPGPRTPQRLLGDADGVRHPAAERPFHRLEGAPALPSAP